MAENEPTRPPRRPTRPHTDDEHAEHPVPNDAPPPEPHPGPPPRGPLAFIRDAQDVMTVRRVYGEPIEKDGVTVIPAANVRGGGGGGFGRGAQGDGGGGGFGVTAKPAGAYVIKDGMVTWKPAIDATRMAVMGQIVAIVFLLTLRSVVKALAKRR